MKIKAFLLCLALLAGILAVSKVYSPAAGLTVFALVGVVLAFGYVVQLFNDLERVAKQAEENDKACAAIRYQRKAKSSV
jgi:hypothetical protein